MSSRKNYNFEPKHLWYLVGLIASDGCLKTDNKSITIASKDLSHLELIKFVLKIRDKVAIEIRSDMRTNKDYKLGVLPIHSKTFYEFLTSIGLTPAKSLTIGELKIPDEYFSDFLRGEIDGDGCIRTWKTKGIKTAQWSLRIYSASSIFINWLKSKIESIYGVSCPIVSKRSKNQHCYVLYVGKVGMKKLLPKIYYSGALALERKSILAQQCIESKSFWKTYYGNEKYKDPMVQCTA